MPNKNKGGYQPHKQISMPKKFRCKVGGEWKPIEGFAANQQKFLQRQKKSTGSIDAAHSGMTCMEHSAKSAVEIRCDLCYLIKPADEFSKNSRKNGVYECKRCVAWAETQEPDVTPAPLETGHISVEEKNCEVWDEEFVDSADFFPDAQPRAPITGLAPLGLGDLEGTHTLSEVMATTSISASGPSSVVSMSSGSRVASRSVSDITGATSLPPHLVGRVNKENNKLDSSAASSKGKGLNLTPTPVSQLPPHLRRAVTSSSASQAASQGDMSSASSVISASEAESTRFPGSNTLGRPAVGAFGSSSASISTATTVRREREDRRVPFNAWDTQGNKHSGVKEPTVISSSVSTVSAGQRSDRYVDSSPNIHGEWPTVSVEEPENRGKGSKWPKASESRIPQNQLAKQPMLPHVSARHKNPDIERQRRMNYCDSDDSDY